MRLSLVHLFTIPVSSSAFGRNAPDGRWLNGESPPKKPRTVPEGSRVACPLGFEFCVDSRWSDAQTCLHPNPHLIKRCLDESCIGSAFGKKRAAEYLEDTYCKDFMNFEGRFCQWTEEVRCTCSPSVEDVVYANGVVLSSAEEAPEGYTLASECVYPSNNIKRMPNGAYVDVPVTGGAPVPPIPNNPKLHGDLFWKDPNAGPAATVRPLAQAIPGTMSADSSAKVNNGITSSTECAAFIMLVLSLSF